MIYFVYGAFACENYKAQKLCMVIFKVLRGWISKPKSYNQLNHSVDSRNKKVFFRLGFLRHTCIKHIIVKINLRFYSRDAITKTIAIYNGWKRPLNNVKNHIYVNGKLICW